VLERFRKGREPAFHLGAQIRTARPAQKQPDVKKVLRPSGIELEEDEVRGLDHRHINPLEPQDLSTVEDSFLPRPSSDDHVDRGLAFLPDPDDARKRVPCVSSPDLDLGAQSPEPVPALGGQERRIEDQNVEILGRAADTVCRERHSADESRPGASPLERLENAGENHRFHGPSLERDGRRPWWAAR